MMAVGVNRDGPLDRRSNRTEVNRRRMTETIIVVMTASGQNRGTNRNGHVPKFEPKARSDRRRPVAIGVDLVWVSVGMSVYVHR